MESATRPYSTPSPDHQQKLLRINKEETGKKSLTHAQSLDFRTENIQHNKTIYYIAVIYYTLFNFLRKLA